jgi:hypothetical protein
MIKNYRMVIDLAVNISEQITPEIIAKANEICSLETDIHPRQQYLDMCRDIVNYIIRHPDLHHECICSSLIFTLASYNDDENLKINVGVEPDIIENNMMIAAEALGPDYEKFVTQLYQMPPEEDDDVAGLQWVESNIINLAEAKAKKKDMPQEERDLLTEIMQLCLLDFTITNSELEPATEEISPITGEYKPVE